MKAKLRKLLPAVFAVLLAAGCGSNVRLEPPTIPEPLINEIPLRVAVRFPENFEGFVHTEEVIGNEEWTIDLGRSNAAFFEQLFGFMFTEVALLQPDQDPSTVAFDALIEPSIDAFEFSVPNQTKTDSFAVWIRYRVKVFDPQGRMVGNWPFSAYGKSLTTTMGGSDALQRAAILAMRDAAALMIIRFDPDEFMRSLSVGGEQQDEAAEAVQATAVEGGARETPE